MSYEFKDGLHTFGVPVKGQDGRDPTFTMTSVSFELAPVTLTRDPDGRMVQEFSIVPAGTLPLGFNNQKEGSGQVQQQSSTKPSKAKKAILKRTLNDVAETELGNAKKIKVW